MGAVFWTPKSQKNIYPSTNSHWESPNAHPICEKIFILSLICNGKGCFLSPFGKFLSLVPTERPQIIGCFEKIFLPLTNSHREMAIVHPVLKNLFTYLEWENVFGNHKSKIGIKKDAYLSISVVNTI